MCACFMLLYIAENCIVSVIGTPYNSGGMTLTVKDQSTHRKAYPSATSSTTYPTWTSLQLIPGSPGER